MSNLKLPNVTNYWAAVRELGNNTYRRIGYKTALQYADDCIMVLHHASPIIKYFEDGTLEISNARHASRTTIDRLHRLTPDWVGFNKRGDSMLITTAGGMSALVPEGPDWYVFREGSN